MAVFLELLQYIATEDREIVKAIEHQITSTINSPCYVKQTRPLNRLRTPVNCGKSLELQISQLKLNPNCTSRIPLLKMVEEQNVTPRFFTAELMNPQTNFYVTQRKLSDLSMASTAEVFSSEVLE